MKSLNEKHIYSPVSPDGFVTVAETVYPETPDEIDAVFQSRKNRESHPSGKTDSGGRWYPSEYERASCCESIRSPSRAHPYSYMVHCRTKKHIQTWYAEHVVRVGEGIGLGAGIGFGAWQRQPLNESDAALERVMCDRLRACSLSELKARRAECTDHALRCYRLLRTAHPSDRRITAEDVTYWIRQAYFTHGEILTRLDSIA